MSCWQIRQLISSYLDDEITPEQRRAMDHHLSSCEPCREALAAYSRIGSELKQSPEIRPPEALRRRVLRRVSAERKRRVASGASVLAGVRLMAAAAVVLMMMVGLVAFWQQNSPGPMAPSTVAVTPGQAYMVPTRAVVKVRFDRPMDTTSVERAILVQPAIDLEFHWDKNTLEVSPAGTLNPNTTYTITVSSNAEDNRGNHLAEPLTVALHAVDENRPVAGAGTTEQASTVPERTETTTATATATETSGAASPSTSVVTGSPSLVAQNTNPVQAVIEVEPTVAGATSPEGSPTVSPAGDGGTMVASNSATKTTARGTATLKPKPSPSSGSAASGHSRPPVTGTTTPPASATTTADIAVATAAPTASPEPTKEVSPTAVVTSTTECQFSVSDRFSALAEEHQDAVAKLECATADAQEVEVTIQHFQGGSIFSLDSEPIVYVVLSDGTWSEYDLDLISSGTLTDTETITPTKTMTPTVTGKGRFDIEGDQPPDGMLEPVGDFGTIWHNISGVREGLGWAIEEEHVADGVLQKFTNGQIVQADEEAMYILDDSGTSLYEDLAPLPTGTTTAEPTETPSPKPSQEKTVTPTS